MARRRRRSKFCGCHCRQRTAEGHQETGSQPAVAVGLVAAATASTALLVCGSGMPAEVWVPAPIARGASSMQTWPALGHWEALRPLLQLSARRAPLQRQHTPAAASRIARISSRFVSCRAEAEGAVHGSSVAVDPDEEPLDGERSSRWARYKDPKSGCFYYYNLETKETQWHRPDDFGASKSKSQAKSTREEVSDESVLDATPLAQPTQRKASAPVARPKGKPRRVGVAKAKATLRRKKKTDDSGDIETIEDAIAKYTEPSDAATADAPVDQKDSEKDEDAQPRASEESESSQEGGSKETTEATKTGGVAPPQLSDDFEAIHLEAVREVLDGFKVGLTSATVVVPTGAGQGAIGSRVLADAWRRRRRPPPAFRAMVLMPKETLIYAESMYRRWAGNGLFVLRMEDGGIGVDRAAQALSTCPGLIMLGSYSDVDRFAMAMRRTRCGFLDLVVYEQAHTALAGDSAACSAVLKDWKKSFYIKALQELYITSKPLELDPVRGLSEALMEMPGMNPYKVVVSGKGGRFGPQVYSLPMEESERLGFATPVRLAALGVFSSKRGQRRGGADLVAQDLVQLHEVLGVQMVEAPPTMSAERVANLTALAQKASGGSLQVVASGTPGADALLMASGDAMPFEDLTGVVDYLPALLTVERLALGNGGAVSREQSTGTTPSAKPVHLLIPEHDESAASAAWRVLLERDERLRKAVKEAAVERGRADCELEWATLPKALRDVAAAKGQRRRKQEKEWLATLVNQIIDEVVDEWYIWYGRLLAYREQGDAADQSVPIDAMIKGYALGQWVARQFLEWRWGGLPEERQVLLLKGGLSLQEEEEKFFAEGLAEFENYLHREGNPYVPADYWTDSGFALGAWAVNQRASWRKGLLSRDKAQLLDSVKFPPVAHPDDVEARAHTLELEGQLRQSRGKNLRARQQIFRSLVQRMHPSSWKNPHAEVVTQFLAGYRDWLFYDVPRQAPRPRRR